MNKSDIEIYMDFDMVIVNTIDAIVKLYNEDFSFYEGFRTICSEQIKTYDFKELTCAKKEQIDTYFNTPRFFEELWFIKNAEQSINELNKYFSVSIVTLGNQPNLALKEAWIYWYWQNITFIGVDIRSHQDKSSVNMADGIFVDDKLSNLETSNARYKILFGDEYEWNRDYDPQKVYRCHDWDEVMKTINKITAYKIIGRTR